MARVLTNPQLGPALDGPPSSGAGQGLAPLLTLGEQVALARAPKMGVRRAANPPPRAAAAQDIVGKIWNAPNTAIGAIYGGLGMAAGEIKHVLRHAPEPGVAWRDNAMQFTNNPFGGVGAITIGNTTTYYDDPHSAKGRQDWADTERIEGHPVWDHERMHTLQGEQIGPLYLPSNLIGGLTALSLDRDNMGKLDWHGAHNWNEIGPQLNPPSLWRPKSE